MSGRLVYGKRYRYAHMLEGDMSLWDRYMELHADAFDTVDYDFRVGKGVELSAEWKDEWKRMAIMLTQKRIDVLAWKEDHPTIIELKGRVELATLGQILGYQSLFVNEFPNIETPSLLVVTYQIGDDDRFVLERYRVPVEVVGGGMAVTH